MDVENKRSPRVREILENEPSWIILYGTIFVTLLLLVIIILVVCLIKPYPFEAFRP